MSANGKHIEPGGHPTSTSGPTLTNAPTPAPEPLDHPFHRDEAVRIGRVVHAIYPGSLGCASARIIGHPHMGVPDEERGEVWLAIDHKPNAMVPYDPSASFRRHAPQSAADMPGDFTWHWPRACPWNR